MPGIMESDQDQKDLFNEVDTILLGRITYEGLCQYWPTAEGDYADKMNTTPKWCLLTRVR
jgi:dihydrofolate reductase